MNRLTAFAGKGSLKCKRPFVDFDGNVWLPGDPLEFTDVTEFPDGYTLGELRLSPGDIEQADVLEQPELYFELPALEA